jgi:hypothetical protein
MPSDTASADPSKTNREKLAFVSKSVPFTSAAAPSSDAISAHLRREEFTVQSGQKGVKRYDVVRVASNSPSEDDFTHVVMADPLGLGAGKDWSAWGIFDGHV